MPSTDLNRVAHTPGPWRVERRDPLTMVKSALGFSIAVVSGTNKQEHANAGLIAAAPDLLEAARAAQAFLTDVVRDPELLASHPWIERQALLAASDVVNAAIAKAEGKS